tara:strand:+ start:182 stop:832 length:651 start_codon:yes stop_codon:yes gene_type:complete
MKHKIHERWDHATNELIEKLKKHNIDFSKLNAIELFGRDGSWHTSIFEKIVKSMEIWEIDSKWKSDLEKNFPESKIQIIDSIKTIQQNSNLPKFDLLLIDNPMNTFGESKDSKRPYCEHFDIINFVAKFVNKKILVIFNVNNQPFDYEKYPDWKKRRDEFYGTDNTANLDIEFMHNFYEKLFKKIGLNVIFKINETRVYYNEIEMTHYFAYYLEKK